MQALQQPLSTGVPQMQPQQSPCAGDQNMARL